LLGIYYVLPLLRNFVDNKPLTTHIDLAITSNYKGVLSTPVLDLAITSNYKGVLSTPALDLATTSNYKGVVRGGLEVALSLTLTPRRYA
ncbi:hypothetical protein AC578_9344, partial [Pseudocercospora eumusae]